MLGDRQHKGVCKRGVRVYLTVKNYNYLSELGRERRKTQFGASLMVK